MMEGVLIYLLYSRSVSKDLCMMVAFGQKPEGRDRQLGKDP